MSEYIIHYKDAETLYEYTDFPFLLEEYLREPIVRCRDCKEFAFGSDECATADWCDYWDAYVESPDGFCKWGERKNDE